MQNVEWGEFKLGDLFQQTRGKEAAPNRVANGIYNMINEISTNNGITKKAHSENIINGNAITISVNYAKNVFYQKDNFCASVNILVLKADWLTENIGLFIASILKFNNIKYNYASKISKERLNNDTILLPAKNSKIDFDFIESFITELEAERLAELEAYLLATGLKNYNLTAEEQQVLVDFEHIKFDKFNVVDVFNVKNTKSILSRDITENSGEVPYLCASTENNAVSSYISYDEKQLDKGNCVFIGGKTFVVSYQEKDFYSNDSHNLSLHLKDEGKRLKLNQLYLATCIDKSLGHKYSWGDSISNKKIQKDKVSLPTKNNHPDYAVMEVFVSAIQKLVIKEVVLYAESKILATNKIVAN